MGGDFCNLPKLHREFSGFGSNKDLISAYLKLTRVNNSYADSIFLVVLITRD